MKMKNNILITIAVLIATVFIFTGCEKELDRPPIKVVDPAKVLEIKDIYQIQVDSGDNYVFTEDYMLYATVVMDDSTGNIYKEAYLQDTTGGINLYKLSSAGALKIGQYVRINLNGASIKNYSGKMELIFSNVLDFGLNMVVQESNVPIEPIEVTIADLLTGEYDCELVTVKDVQFVDGEINMTYANLGGTSSQNRNIVDCTGGTLIVRNSDYSSFAADSLPDGKGNITGIATKYQYSGGDIVWQLLIRNPNEVLLTGPRCGATE
jgi:hypothetical protein